MRNDRAKRRSEPRNLPAMPILYCIGTDTGTRPGEQQGKAGRMTMKRWHILLLIGLAGVASLLLAGFEQLAPGMQLSLAMRLLMLIQPAILTVAAVSVGQALAAKAGLGAPLVDAWLQGGNLRTILKRQMPPALLVGLAVSLLMITYARVILPSVTDAVNMAKMTAFPVPLTTRILYGGITEELLTRWGLMSFFAWALWRLSGKGSPTGHFMGRHRAGRRPLRRRSSAASVHDCRAAAAVADHYNPARQFYPRPVVRVAVLASGTGGSNIFPRLRPLRECARILNGKRQSARPPFLAFRI